MVLELLDFDEGHLEIYLKCAALALLRYCYQDELSIIHQFPRLPYRLHKTVVRTSSPHPPDGFSLFSWEGAEVFCWVREIKKAKFKAALLDWDLSNSCRTAAARLLTLWRSRVN